MRSVCNTCSVNTHSTAKAGRRGGKGSGGRGVVWLRRRVPGVRSVLSCFRLLGRINQFSSVQFSCLRLLLEIFRHPSVGPYSIRVGCFYYCPNILFGFFLACIIIAGIYGAYSTKTLRLFYIQAVPALIAIILLCIPYD